MIDRLQIDRALRRVAREYHMPVAQVKRNIRGVPEEARANPDPQIQAAWEALLQEGESSTVEDVIARINAKRR